MTMPTSDIQLKQNNLAEDIDETEVRHAIDDSADDKLPLQPAPRGTWQCWCRGQVLMMFDYYGWIMSMDEIDHPDVDKNGGRIYLSKNDITSGSSFVAGDIVGFYLYADKQGLGAESCSLETAATTSLTFTADAPKLVPTNTNHESSIVIHLKSATCPDVEEFVPSHEDSGSSLTPCAQEFVPSNSPALATPIMNPDAAEFVPSFSMSSHVLNNISVINLSYLSDDSDDEDSVCGDEFGGSLDHDMEPKGVKQDATPNAEMCRQPLKESSHRSGSVDGSTSAGSSSDSDTDNASTSKDSEADKLAEVFCQMTGKMICPPPGLILPPPWRRAKRNVQSTERSVPCNELPVTLTAPYPWRRARAPIVVA